MSERDLPAYPLLDDQTDKMCYGLTKFEYACIKIAAGLASNIHVSSFDIAEQAVMIAGYLFDKMEELEKDDEGFDYSKGLL